MEEDNIRQISFPNTVADIDKTFYEKKMGYSFRYFNKNGEMALIAWIQVSKDGKVVAEIKESVCDIYY